MAEAASVSGDGAHAGLGKDFLLEIVTPEKLLLSESVVALRAPGSEGEFGVLPSHERLITSLGVGMIRYQAAGDTKWTELPVSAGLVEVLPDRVIILAQTAEAAHDVDVGRAEAALERAKDKLAGSQDEEEVEEALAALKRATLRLQAARGDDSES